MKRQILIFQQSSPQTQDKNRNVQLWNTIIYIDTLHWSEITTSFARDTDQDLITEFDFLPNFARFP